MPVQTKNLSKYGGFTLVEAMMTVVVFILIGYATFALVSNLFTNSSQQSSLLSSVDQARRVVFSINNELRKATTGATGGFSIAQAGEQQLIFYSNIDASPDVERVRYFSQNGRLHKGVIKPTGSPASYVSGNEVIWMIQNNLANGATPLFYYYDGTYDGTSDTPLVQPVNINLIKLVKINLMILNTAGSAGTNTYTVSTAATIRNLKTNLGD
jgi:type II secretory pathway component PulJ